MKGKPLNSKGMLIIWLCNENSSIGKRRSPKGPIFWHLKDHIPKLSGTHHYFCNSGHSLRPQGTLFPAPGLSCLNFCLLTGLSGRNRSLHSSPGVDKNIQCWAFSTSGGKEHMWGKGGQQVWKSWDLIDRKLHVSASGEGNSTISCTAWALKYEEKWLEKKEKQNWCLESS